MRTLLFGIGCSLPFIALSDIAAPEDLGVFARMAFVDYLAILALAMILLEGRGKSPLPAILYCVSLILGLLFGFLRSHHEGTSMDEAFVSFGALMMAFGYYVVGLVSAQRRDLARALFAGIVVGVYCESVVVIHDYLATSQWFQDTLEGRVRGTFRASGQLAAYGYSSAGLLLAIGWCYFRQNRTRLTVTAAGALAVFFVVAATRRSGLFALGVWLTAFLLLGTRHVKSRSYVAAFSAAAVLCLSYVMFQDKLSQSFLGYRIARALEGIQNDDNFIVLQAREVLDRAHEWFPFGLGAGQGQTTLANGRVYEIHNGHLALVVELGLLGILAFYLMSLAPVLGRWNANLAKMRIRPLVISFIFASMLFMVHNRLHRDRGFMLFLGMATMLSATSKNSAAASPVAASRRGVSRAGVGAGSGFSNRRPCAPHPHSLPTSISPTEGRSRATVGLCRDPSE